MSLVADDVALVLGRLARATGEQRAWLVAEARALVTGAVGRGVCSAETATALLVEIDALEPEPRR